MAALDADYYLRSLESDGLGPRNIIKDDDVKGYIESLGWNAVPEGAGICKKSIPYERPIKEETESSQMGDIDQGDSAKIDTNAPEYDQMEEDMTGLQDIKKEEVEAKETHETDDEHADGAMAQEGAIDNNNDEDGNESDKDSENDGNDDLDEDEICIKQSANPAWGPSYLIVNGEKIRTTVYLGDEWTALVKALHGQAPMQTPPGMKMQPHVWQLKGAQQADFACEGPFRGFICGDEMGLGKTLLGVLAIWLRKDEPGISAVVAPKSVCEQWLKAFQDSFQPGYGLHAHILDDPRTTAAQLLAAKYDVVITSYEFLAAGERAKRIFADKVALFKDGIDVAPSRPVCALYSDVWKIYDLPFKRVLLDEAQKVNKTDGVRHQAIKALYAKAFIVLSGTLAHNKWHDFAGIIDFIPGQPFRSMNEFLVAFEEKRHIKDNRQPPNDIAVPAMRVLQRLLQAFMIARPSSVLKLPGLHDQVYPFDLRTDAMDLIAEIKKSYDSMIGMRIKGKEGAKGKPGNADKGPIALLSRGRIYGLHPLLIRDATGSMTTPKELKEVQMAKVIKRKRREAKADEEYVPGQDPDESSDNGSDEEDEDEDFVKAPAIPRLEFLETIKATENLLFNAPRLQAIMQLYRRLRQEYPDRKIAIFSEYLQFLDIIEAQFNRTYKGVTPITYHGGMNSKDRSAARAAFEKAHPKVPFLITAGSGGVGLNITCASILIQTEPWWNANAQRQAFARLHRQGQKTEVKVYQIRATNSVVEDLVVATAIAKTKVSQELMEPLCREYDQDPCFLPLLC